MNYYSEVLKMGQPLSPVLQDLIERAKKEIRKHPQASMGEIAELIGLGRTTFYLKLKKAGYSFEQLRREVFQEVEAERQRKLKRKELKELPPKSYEEFLEYESVKRIREKLETAPLSRSHREKVLRLIYRVCRLLNVAPSEINADTLVEYYKRLKDTRDENQLRIEIKTIAKWLEISLPPYIEIAEYKGKFVTAELDVRLRYLFLRTAKEVLNQKEYELVRAASFFLFRGGRRESLITARIGEVVELGPIPEFGGESKFQIILTEEKGKKGRKIRWSRLIPLSEWKYVKQLRLPLSIGDVKRLEKLFKQVFSEMLKRYGDIMNQDTKEYLAHGKVFHIWRHTAAREYLRAFKWNRYLVAKLLGWVKPDNLQIYGDYSALELLQLTYQKKVFFQAMFLYGEWKRRAEEEGLL